MLRIHVLMGEAACKGAGNLQNKDSQSRLCAENLEAIPAPDRGGLSMSVVNTFRDGARLTITLNRPDRLNAIVPDMLEEMLEMLDAAAADTTLRVVVLTGAGRGFCAGGDLHGTGSGGRPGRVETAIAASRRVMRISQTFRSMPQQVIAAINGPCAGAGLSWACAADLRIAVDTTTFATAFGSAAVGGDHGISWLLPRIVGLGRAAELMLLGEKFGAQDALRIGLVSRVVPPAELMPVVDQWTTRLLGLAPGALAAMKANLRESQTLSLGEALDREAERLSYAFRHPDAGEAARAFLEQRPPHFAD